MIQALRNAIYTTGLTVTGVTTANLWYLEAKEDTTFPYVVFSDVTDVVSRDSGTDFENYDIQFSIFSDVLTETESFSAAIKSKFDYGKSNLSVSGYTVVEVVRTLEPSVLKEDKIYHHVLQYKITISKSR